MKLLITFILFFQSFLLIAQNNFTIQGHFPNFPNSRYELKGYEGLQQKTLSTAKSKDDGKFTLTYPNHYKGVGQLWMNGAYQVLLFLNKENITLHWEDLTNRDNLKTNSQEYQAFLGGMKTFQDSEAKLAGLHYLIPLYAQDSIKQQLFVQELDTVANAFPSYIKKLPKNLFVRQYLLTKGLIEQMPKTVETYQWRAPNHIPEFMAIDFKALQHSGLYKNLLEGYTNLVERFPLEEVYPLLNAAIDKVLNELKDNPTLQQEIAQLWLPYLESHSLLKSAEHLAVQLTQYHNTIIDEALNSKLQHYLTLKVGNTAPNIQLTEGKSLIDIGKNILLVFGAAECGHCMASLAQLKQYYPKWQAKNTEVVYISIDTDQDLYNTTFANLPFTTYCNFKGWNTQAAKDYYINATPTYILLDKDLKILAHPNNLENANQYIAYKI